MHDQTQDSCHVCRDAESLAVHAREWLVDQIRGHTQEHTTPFSLALSGGSTPKRLYQLLSELPVGTVDWSSVILIWGDERNVAPDHPDSNFRMVRENLLDHIDIPLANVLAVPDPGGTATESARKYDQLLCDRLPSGSDGLPLIDCVLLGMGDDVHTASLFPGTKALAETNRVFVENWVDKLDCWRMTLTAKTISAASRVTFLIAGAAKQQALHSLWHGPRDPQLYPSQLIRPDAGKLWFMLDQAALGNNRVPASCTLGRFH